MVMITVIVIIIKIIIRIIIIIIIVITCFGDPQETARLFQRLSICTQRFSVSLHVYTFDR
jgi:hypothetical protein